MTTRPGRVAFSLLEVLVAATLSMICLVIAYNGVVGVARSQKSSDIRASRALLEAQVMEVLLQDLRSTSTPRPDLGSLALPAPGPAPGGPVTFTRNVFRDGVLDREEVTWRAERGERIVREVKGRRTHSFDFKGLFGPDLSALSFKLEPLPDREFGTPGSKP